MKSKITILAITMAGLTQVAEVQSQQPFAAGYSPYARVASQAGGAAPMQQPIPPAYPAPGAVPNGVAGAFQAQSLPAAAMAAPTTPVSVMQSGPAIQPVPQSLEASGGSVMPQGVHYASPPTASYPSAGEVYGGGYAGPMPSSEPMPVGEGWSSSPEACDSSGGIDFCDSCGLPGGACGCGGGFLSGLFGSAGRPSRIWGGVDYLYWWNKERTVPALVTTSPAGTPQAQAGVLGQPGTSVLFGGQFDDEATSGVRGTLGFWLDQRQTLGVFGRAFRISEDIGFNGSSTGEPILARPFFDADINAENSLVAAFPGISEGGINVATTNEITGYDVMLRKMLYYGDCNRIDFVGGYQSTQVDDGVHVEHQITSLDPNGRVPVGTQINTRDWFDVENEFHGGTIGLMAQGYDGRLTWNLLTKIGFGNTAQTVTIRGESTTLVPNAGSATFNQGLLALDTNSGVYEQDAFTVVPELDLSVAYSLTNRLAVSIGYSLIYWSNVAVAGDTIDSTINPTQIDGPLIGVARPVFNGIDDGSFWAHGLTAGLQGRF